MTKKKAAMTIVSLAGIEGLQFAAAQARRHCRYDVANISRTVREQFKAHFKIEARLSKGGCAEFAAIAEKAHERGFVNPRPETQVFQSRVGAGLDALVKRSNWRLERIYMKAIRERGGETGIIDRDGTTRLTISARSSGLCVLHCEGYRAYSKAFGARRARLSYLCGKDDSGYWAVRVAGTITTVSAALDFVEPAEVKAARDKGRQILRQGDVYFVETRERLDCTGENLPRSHKWDFETRTSTHAEHAPLLVPFFCKFYRQHAYQMGRTGARGDAD
jgi:hypothetical protein